MSKEEAVNEELMVILERHSSPIDEYRAFRAPTPPVPGCAGLPEFVDHSTLVIAVTWPVSLQGPLFDVLLDIAEAGVRACDVLVLVDDTFMETAMKVVQGLEGRGLWPAPEQGNRVQLMDVPLNSIWVRDFGPLFSSAADGRVVFNDCIYRDVRRGGSENFFSLLETPGAAAQRTRDDAAPMYLASHLSVLDKEINAVRPPIILWGGDFATDGMGNYFVSSETLRMNGGAREEFEFLLMEYYGASTVTYLEALPGHTIKHIDMFFRVVDEETLLLAEYPEVADEHPYLGYIHRRARWALERNAARLREMFPEKKIVRVPMPPAELVSALGMSMRSGQGLTDLPVEAGASLLGMEDFDAEDPEENLAQLFALYWCSMPERETTGGPADWVAVALLDQMDDMRPMEVEILGIPTSDDCIFLERALDLVSSRPRECEEYLFGDSILTDWLASEPAGMIPDEEQERLVELLAGTFSREEVQWLHSHVWGAEAKTKAMHLYDRYYDPWLTGDWSERLWGSATTDPDNYALVYRPYSNYCLVRGELAEVLLMPTFEGFGSENESALEVLSMLHPEAEVVPIESTQLALAYGGVHCVTLQVPRLR